MKRRFITLLLALMLLLSLMPAFAQAVTVTSNNLRVKTKGSIVRLGGIKTDLNGTSFGNALELGAKVQGSGPSINYEVYFGDTAPIVFKGNNKSFEVPVNTDGSTYGYWIATKVEVVSSTNERYYFEWHEHDEMTSDENGHSVQCTGCDTPNGGFHFKVEAAPHTAGDTVFVPNAGTCGDNASGENITYCAQAGCGYVMSREAGTGKVDHIEGAPVQENLVPATCDEDGSFDTVVYCANGCGHVFSRTTSTLTQTGHNVNRNDWSDIKEIVEKEPTCTEDGRFRWYSYCKNPGCDYLEDALYSGVIDKLGHKAGETKIENSVAATCTAPGSYDVVIYCANGCGGEYSRTPKTLTQLDHVPGTSVQENVVNATCSAPGSYDEVVYCANGCGEEYSRTPKTIDQLDHVQGTPVQENVVNATCSAPGSYDEVVYCANGCNTEISRTKKTIDQLQHVQGTPVQENVVNATCTVPGSYDEVVYCQNNGCGIELSRTPVTGQTLPHTPGTPVQENVVNATCTVPGSYDEVVYCQNNGCGIELSRTPVTGQTLPHSFDESAWSSDADNHWHVCKDCPEKGGSAAHTLVWNNVKEPTTTEAGLKVQECSVCGYEADKEEIPMLIPDPGAAAPSGGAISDLPKTGDESHLMMWIALVIASICGVGAVTFFKKKNIA